MGYTGTFLYGGGSTHQVATSTYSYDSLGRLTGLAYTKGGNNLFTPYSWTFDSLSSTGMDFGEAVADPRAGATAAAAVFSGLGRIRRWSARTARARTAMMHQERADLGHPHVSRATKATRMTTTGTGQ